MKQRMFKICALMLLALALSGCSSLFDHSYTSVSEFRGSEEIELNAATEVVKSYSALRRRIHNMVNNHEESAELLISGYSGDVASDIASICGSVNVDSAYGAYCVEYVSYDLTQIVSYYEAAIHITYKYTAEELEGMVTVSNHSMFSESVAEQLASGCEHLLFKVNNASGDDNAVVALVERSCRNHPMQISYIPKVTAKVYSGNSSQKIYEIRVEYGDEWAENSQRIMAMTTSLTVAKRSVPPSSDAWMIVNAARYLSGCCAVSNDGGSTAYDALVNNQADSEGIASAFKALCDDLNIECQVIEGMLDKNPHYWNLVKIDNDYYHVDVSELLEKGGAESLFLNDSTKSATCWWNLSDYPACEGDLTYDLVVEPGTEEHVTQ